MTVATTVKTESFIRWRYLWWALSAIAVMIAAIVAGNIWFLDFIHVFSSRCAIAAAERTLSRFFGTSSESSHNQSKGSMAGFGLTRRVDLRARTQNSDANQRAPCVNSRS